MIMRQLPSAAYAAPPRQAAVFNFLTRCFAGHGVMSYVEGEIANDHYVMFPKSKSRIDCEGVLKCALDGSCAGYRMPSSNNTTAEGSYAFTTGSYCQWPPDRLVEFDNKGLVGHNADQNYRRCSNYVVRLNALHQGPSEA